MADEQYEILVIAASKQMLNKNKPEGRDDWVKVMNFVAWNVDYRNCYEVCRDIARMNEAPLSNEEILEIVDFQTYNRAARNLTSQEQNASLLSDLAIRNVSKFFGGRF